LSKNCTCAKRDACLVGVDRCTHLLNEIQSARPQRGHHPEKQRRQGVRHHQQRVKAAAADAAATTTARPCSRLCGKLLAADAELVKRILAGAHGLDHAQLRLQVAQLRLLLVLLVLVLVLLVLVLVLRLLLLLILRVGLVLLVLVRLACAGRSFLRVVLELAPRGRDAFGDTGGERLRWRALCGSDARLHCCKRGVLCRIIYGRRVWAFRSCRARLLLHRMCQVAMCSF
jgi:hypothetical protein